MVNPSQDQLVVLCLLPQLFLQLVYHCLELLLLLLLLAAVQLGVVVNLLLQLKRLDIQIQCKRKPVIRTSSGVEEIFLYPVFL